MQFFLNPVGALNPPQEERPFILLKWDDWNDYSFLTYFQIFASLPNNNDLVFLGNIRIMHLGQKEGERSFPQETVSFETLADLDGEFCSLGESITYYKGLLDIGEEFGRSVLTALCDASFDAEIRAKFEGDECFKVSLVRYNSSVEALDKGGHLFGATERLVENFTAEISLPQSTSPHELLFDFREHNGLPRRVNLLVGLNGVGKTQLMARLAIVLSRFAKKDHEEGAAANYAETILHESGAVDPMPSIYNVIAVSFSAFDSFDIPSVGQTERFKYSYCGLREETGGTLSEDEILDNVISLIGEMDDAKHEILVRLSSQLIQVDDVQDFITHPEEHQTMYGRLSAGQRIALNIISHLISNISDNSLVMIDEPETHLHPKLMTTLMSAITDILDEFSSYAIVATHSPIIVQQIPSKYIHIIRRDAGIASVVTPLTECFGENLSEISRNVFSAVESDRDYETVLDKLLEEHEGNAETVEGLFDLGLGMNARIYLHSRAKEM